jgi:hydrogenase maturation protease
VGNLVHTDDGVGIHAIRRLQADSRVPEGVDLIDAGTFGLELLAYLESCSRLLLLDAVDVGEPPGTFVRMAGEELLRLPGGASVHQLGVADLLTTLPLIFEAPPEIVLLGIQPESTDWGAELSPAIAAALAALVDAAVEQLRAWSNQAETEVARTSAMCGSAAVSD